MNEPKKIDEIIYNLVARGALAANGIPQDADKIVQEAKQTISEWIRESDVELNQWPSSEYLNGFRDGSYKAKQSLLTELESKE